MEKYMGNKSKFCSIIYDEISNFIELNGNVTMFDPFTGTTNVSRYFKSKGVNIICNDINDLSYALAKAYIEMSKFPTFSKLYKDIVFRRKLSNLKKSNEFKVKKLTLIDENHNTTSTEFLNKIQGTRYLEVLVYLTYFCNEEDYQIDFSFFQDNYCEGGKNSRYINLVYKKTLEKIKIRYNGTKIGLMMDSFFKYPFDENILIDIRKHLYDIKDLYSFSSVDKIIRKGNVVGERMFFSIQHAKRLDHILNTIMYWLKNDLITKNEYYILITSIIETVCIFSNTSATYQAFYKGYRANTLQSFRLIIPEIDETKIKTKIYKEDAYTLIPKISADVIYLDPPYNWRQYDSNYHLLNTIARLYEIEDKELFFSEIVGASGENRIRKLQYTSFNKRSTFEETLLIPLSNSKCKIVALSYSDSGSNHKRENIDSTLEAITSFFSNKEMFSDFKIVKVRSKNFESRKGNKKEDINELLFIAQRK